MQPKLLPSSNPCKSKRAGIGERWKMDPFASVELECGKISNSQEDLLRHAPFLNDSHPSHSDAIFPSSPSPSDAPRYADAPILICSLPDSQDSDSAAQRPALASTSQSSPKPQLKSPAASSFPIPKAQGKSPTGRENPLSENPVSAKQARHVPRVSGKRGRGPLIRTPSDDEGDSGVTKSKEDINKYRYQSLQVLKDVLGGQNGACKAAPVQRRLPLSIQNQQEGSIVTVSCSVATAGAPAQSLHTAEEGDEGVTKSKDDIDKYRYQSLQSPKDAIGRQNAACRATPAPQKLPLEGDGGVTKSIDDLDKYRYQLLQSPKNAICGQNATCGVALVPRKLPLAFQNQQEGSGVTVSGSKAHAGASLQPFPTAEKGDGGVTKLKDDLDKFKYQSLQFPKDAICGGNAACRAAPVPRELQPVVPNQQEAGIVIDSGSLALAGSSIQPMPTAEVAADPGRAPTVPVDLADFISLFSKESDRIFAETDILEFAASKGIHFPPPLWWRPGGYNTKVSKEAK